MYIVSDFNIWQDGAVQIELAGDYNFGVWTIDGPVNGQPVGSPVLEQLNQGGDGTQRNRGQVY